MNLFFDTSAFIKHYIEEAGSDRVTSLLNECDGVTMCATTQVECISTLRRLLREKALSRRAYAQLREEINTDFAYFHIVDANGALSLCEPLIDRHQLKTLDSLQLASALHMGGHIDGFVCCDSKLLQAARKESLPTVNPLDGKPPTGPEG